MSKKISVIIPCFNQSQFLIETCNSLIMQTHKNWEAIIIDDGSTDATKLIANNICKNDSRFNYFSKTKGGSSSARNYGLDQVKGDYIQFLDADDIITADKFEKSLAATSSYDIVISDFILFRDQISNTFDAYCDLSVVEYSYLSFLTKWDIEFTIPIHCGLFSTKSIGNIRFNESLKAKEDWVFWLELYKKNPSTQFINEKLAYYRLHQNSKTQQKAFMYSNTKLTINHIYNSISQEDKDIFIPRIINELVDERAKSDYLFNLKKENETSIAKKDHTILRIKKSIIYKTLVKAELFIRRK